MTNVKNVKVRIKNSNGEEKEKQIDMTHTKWDENEATVLAQLMCLCTGSELLEVETLDNDKLLLEVDDLLPGDVLLHHYMNPEPIQSRMSRATNSPYTHASIIVSDKKMAEASPDYITIEKIPNEFPEQIVGVLRSQLGFGQERIEMLDKFTKELVDNNIEYDFKGIAEFSRDHKEFFDNQLKEIENKYGQCKSIGDYSKNEYFCSALIVACFSVVGIIGDKAQVLYPPKLYSPGDIHRDVTFGWLLGYLVPSGYTFPESDPLLSLPKWKDFGDDVWWKM